MRKIYTPPSTASGLVLPSAGALLLALGVFLVLPLSQLISSKARKSYSVRDVEVAMAPPPPPAVMEEPPPPEQPPDEPPPPELTDSPPPMNLGNFDLDIALGTGGAMAGLGASLNQVADAIGNVSIFDLSELDQKPDAVARVSPRYPPELLRSKVEGTVVMVFVVNEKGEIENPRVESSSRVEFERPALEALKRWKFKPGKKEGEAVKAYMRLPFSFKVRGS